MSLKLSGSITVESKPSSRAWFIVALLFFGSVLNYLDRITITTMRVSIMEEIPMTEAEFGILTSVFLWVYGFFSPVAGFIADRFSRSKVIITSLFVFSLVTWLTSHAATYEQLVISRALMGISEAAFLPAGLALIMDYHRGPTRSIATSIMICGNMAGSGLGFIGGWIAEKHNWQWAFHIFGIIGLIFGILLIFFLRDARRKADETDGKSISSEPKTRINFLESIKDLFVTRSYIYLLIFWGLIGIAGWIIVGWLPTFYQERFNLTQTKAGLYATGYLYPASIASLLIGGFWADYWSKRNPRGRIFVVVIGMCIAGPCVFLASISSVLPLTVLFFFGYGLTKMFGSSNLMPVLTTVVDPRYRATGYGLLNLVSTVLGGIGLYAAGAMRDLDINLDILFRVAAVMLLICGLMFYLVKPREENN